ncbi:hypothetical protein MNBD_GAMMA01-705, partial [hydrothermal vent metagenome]
MNFLKTLFLIPVIFLLVFSFSPKKDIPVTPETALQSYLDNGDKTYKWELKESYDIGHN